MADKYESLIELSADEVVTHSFVRDVPISDGKVLALVTLDNGRDHNRPNTLGPATMKEYGETLANLKSRAKAGEIHAVAVTGKQYILAAGADLTKAGEIPSREMAKLLAQQGHAVLSSVSELGVPSFVFINGLALGGGVEIALNAHYRTVDSSIPALALPEVFPRNNPRMGRRLVASQPHRY